MNEELKFSTLANPDSELGFSDLSDYSKDELIDLLNLMLLIRLSERKLAEQRKDGNIGGPVHLGVGQEAIASGLSCSLTNSDQVFGAHRSHSHLLSLTRNSYPLFAEVLGKNTGYSKGMGGSMHLWDKSSGFYGSVPIVAGTVSLATGSALASKLKSNDSVAIAYLGDGAIEEGVVHESLNFASLNKLPIIFVVENNLFASHMHITLRQPEMSVSRFAQANNIDFELVDGNDVLKVRESARRLIDKARLGTGPGFIEAVTYRWYGHVDWREDVDVGVNRSSDDIQLWRNRDPIKRLSDEMIKYNLLDETILSEIESKIYDQINEDWNKALLDPYPDENALLDRVYYRG